ncbi:FxsA family protein [Maritimibacter dapengensis]|uniref:FxsA family protein n=1 Tax=Maritimibacter dapengensis TaxID=2836868 RepID=A0ABS6T6E5_9RHOB|nr:FxsA family protein [Maritimibacter dapengensis]MBV7380086.1 FxsA family protein [Maritimibacter dapengensis]
MWLLFAFIAVPLIEIGLFIQVGGWLGLWPTLLIVLVTAIIGSWMVRQQGALALGQVRDSFNQLSDPSEPLAHGAMILFSGALLLTPGFFTDTVGFLLLIPAFRAFAFREIKKRIKVQSYSSFTVHETHRPHRPGEDVIDGEFEDVTPDKKPTHTPVQGPSGWTKH